MKDGQKGKIATNLHMEGGHPRYKLDEEHSDKGRHSVGIGLKGF